MRPLIRFSGCLLSVGLLAVVPARARSYAEIETLARAGDFEPLQACISADGGTASNTAALALMAAAAQGNQTLIDRLIATGVPVDASPADGEGQGETPLMYAVGANRSDTVALLLRHGAKANYVGSSPGVMSDRQHAALIGAVVNDNVPIARLLLEAGADPNTVGGTAVNLANAMGEIEMYTLLTRFGGMPPAVPDAPKPPGASEARALQSLGVAQLLPAVPPNAAPAAGACRLAIIADDENASAADLLVAKLSDRAGLQLIERQEVERVLAERAFTRQFASDIAHFGEFAPLLRADALLLVRSRRVADVDVVEAKFVRVHPGVVLDTVYRPAPVDAAKWVDDIAPRIDDLAARASRPAALAVSLLDARSSAPNEATREIERSVSLLLRDRLVHDPDVVLLERGDLDKVEVERDPSRAFWSARCLIDPVVDAAADHTTSVQLTLRVERTGQKPLIIRAAGLQLDAAAIVDDAMRQFHTSLGIAPAAWDAATEAKRYLDEARWSLAAKMPSRAYVAAETAWALGEHSTATARLRFEAGCAAIGEQAMSGATDSRPADWLDLATHVTGLWVDGAESTSVQQNPAELQAWLSSVTEVNDAVLRAFVALPTAAVQIPQAQRLANLRATHWSSLVRAEHIATERQLADASKAISVARARALRVTVRNPAELEANARELFSRHFPKDDALTRAQMRLAFSWDDVAVTEPSTHVGRTDWKRLYLPPDRLARPAIAKVLRETGAADDAFLATLLEARPGVSRLSDTEKGAVMSAYWQLRDVLAQDARVFSAYQERFGQLVSEVLVGAAPPSSIPVLLDGPEKPATPLTTFEFQRQLYLYLVEHATAANASYEDLLAMSRYTPEQRSEIRTAYLRYCQRTGTPVRSLASLRAAPTGRQLSSAANRPAPASSSAQLRPLIVGRLWTNQDNRGASNFMLQNSTLQWAENRVWAYGGGVDAYRQPAVYRAVVAVDCNSGKAEMYVLPNLARETRFVGQAALTVTPRHLVVASKNEFVAVCDRATRTWEIFDALKPSQTSAPTVIQDCAYFLADEGTTAMRLDLVGRQARPIASTRRRPAESPLDDTGLYLSQLWGNEAGQIVVGGETDPLSASQSRITLAGFDPNSGTWTTLQPATLKSGLSLPDPHRVALPIAGRFSGGQGFILALHAKPDPTNPGLILHLTNPIGSLNSIPLDLRVAHGLEPATNDTGQQGYYSVTVCYEVPNGYVIPFALGGPGFWFLPKHELDAYLSSGGRL